MEENTDFRLTECDFCINCNTVLLQASNKVSKIFRTISNKPISSSSLLSKHSDNDETETVKTEVSLAKAISITFKVNDMMDVSSRSAGKGNQTPETHFVCEKCGKLLEMAYNAIQDFMELTRRGSVLMDKLKTKSVSLSPLKLVPKKRSHGSTSPLKRSRSTKGKKLKKAKDSDNQHQRHGQGISKRSRLSSAKETEANSDNSERKSLGDLQQPKEQVLRESQYSANNVSLNLCAHCDMEVDQSEYQEHLKLHDELGETENESNHENDDYNFDLADHDDTSVEVIKCKFCSDENSSSLEELKEHYSKTHSLVSILTVQDMDEKGKSCELPNDNLEKNDLPKESVSTSGRLIFNCNVCNKRFVRHDHIKLHLRTHTGEKPFLCKVNGCGKAFSDPRGLAYHEITHSDARPYCCKFCGMTFKRLHHLNDHERNHSEVPRPFLCQFCDKAFKHRKHLNSHLVIHRGTKEHQCNLCFKSFNRKDNLQQHLRKVHPKLSTSDHIEIDLQDTNTTGKNMLEGVDVVAVAATETAAGVTSKLTLSSATTVFQSSTLTFTTTGTIGNELTSVLTPPPPTSIRSIINSPNGTTVTIPVSLAIATDQIHNPIDQLVQLHTV